MTKTEALGRCAQIMNVLCNIPDDVAVLDFHAHWYDNDPCIHIDGENMPKENYHKDVGAGARHHIKSDNGVKLLWVTFGEEDDGTD